MFVGWIRKETFVDDLEKFSEKKIIDKNLILTSYESRNDLCYGAYDKDKLVCFLTAYEFENSLIINNFYYFDTVDDKIKERVLRLFLNNSSFEEKTILILSNVIDMRLLETFFFKKYADFTKAIYTGDAESFDFSNEMAKSLSNKNCMSIVNSVDTKAFQEKRIDYIKEKLFKTSSLLLSTSTGYLHSYALHTKIIKISPWVTEEHAFDDAEKLLRAVVFHRGLKKIIAYIPKESKKITKLYKSYNFELSDNYQLMYKNKKPKIDLEMIYAL